VEVFGNGANSFRFFDFADEIGDVGLESGIRDDDIRERSLEKADGSGWCMLM